MIDALPFTAEFLDELIQEGFERAEVARIAANQEGPSFRALHGYPEDYYGNT